MKNFQNSFKVSGFVGFSEVRAFSNASVCRFSISVSRTEKPGGVRTSAFLNAEAWKKNDMEELDTFKILAKGNMVTIEGSFKPEEWVDEDGQRHNRIVLAAKNFYLTEDKPEEKPAETKKAPKTSTRKSKKSN